MSGDHARTILALLAGVALTTGCDGTSSDPPPGGTAVDAAVPSGPDAGALPVVRGIARTTAPTTPTDLAVRVRWEGEPPDDRPGVPLPGPFPLAFELPVPTPSAAAFTGSPGGPAYAIATVLAVPPGPLGDDVPAGAVLGVAERQLLLLLDGPAVAGSELAERLGGPLPAGLSVLAILAPGEGGCTADDGCLRPASGDAAVLDLHLDAVERLRFPDL